MKVTVKDLISILLTVPAEAEVVIPCPHCCGQHGTDFDTLDHEQVHVIGPEGVSFQGVSRSPLAYAYAQLQGSGERENFAGCVLFGALDQNCLGDLAAQAERDAST